MGRGEQAGGKVGKLSFKAILQRYRSVKNGTLAVPSRLTRQQFISNIFNGVTNSPGKAKNMKSKVVNTSVIVSVLIDGGIGGGI